MPFKLLNLFPVITATAVPQEEIDVTEEEGELANEPLIKPIRLVELILCCVCMALFLVFYGLNIHTMDALLQGLLLATIFPFPVICLIDMICQITGEPIAKTPIFCLCLFAAIMYIAASIVCVIKYKPIFFQVGFLLATSIVGFVTAAVFFLDAILICCWPMFKYNKQMICKHRRVRKHIWVTRRDIYTMTVAETPVEMEEDLGSLDNLMPHPGPKHIDYSDIAIQCDLDDGSGDKYRIPVKEERSSTSEVLFVSRTFSSEKSQRYHRRSSLILKHEQMSDKGTQTEFSAFSQKTTTPTPKTPETKETDDSIEMQILEISNQIHVQSTEKDPNIVVKIADIKIIGFQVSDVPCKCNETVNDNQTSPLRDQERMANQGIKVCTSTEGIICEVCNKYVVPRSEKIKVRTIIPEIRCIIYDEEKCVTEETQTLGKVDDRKVSMVVNKGEVSVANNNETVKQTASMPCKMCQLFSDEEAESSTKGESSEEYECICEKLGRCICETPSDEQEKDGSSSDGLCSCCIIATPRPISKNSTHNQTKNYNNYNEESSSSSEYLCSCDEGNTKPKPQVIQTKTEYLKRICECPTPHQASIEDVHWETLKTVEQSEMSHICPRKMHKPQIICWDPKKQQSEKQATATKSRQKEVKRKVICTNAHYPLRTTEETKNQKVNCVKQIQTIGSPRRTSLLQAEPWDIRTSEHEIKTLCSFTKTEPVTICSSSIEELTWEKPKRRDSSRRQTMTSQEKIPALQSQSLDIKLSNYDMKTLCTSRKSQPPAICSTSTESPATWEASKVKDTLHGQAMASEEKLSTMYAQPWAVRVSEHHLKTLCSSTQSLSPVMYSSSIQLQEPSQESIKRKGTTNKQGIANQRRSSTSKAQSWDVQLTSDQKKQKYSSHKKATASIESIPISQVVPWDVMVPQHEKKTTATSTKIALAKPMTADEIEQPWQHTKYMYAPYKQGMRSKENTTKEEVQPWDIRQSEYEVTIMCICEECQHMHLAQEPEQLSDTGKSPEVQEKSQPENMEAWEKEALLYVQNRLGKTSENMHIHSWNYSASQNEIKTKCICLKCHSQDKKIQSRLSLSNKLFDYPTTETEISDLITEHLPDDHSTDNYYKEKEIKLTHPMKMQARLSHSTAPQSSSQEWEIVRSKHKMINQEEKQIIQPEQPLKADTLDVAGEAKTTHQVRKCSFAVKENISKCYVQSWNIIESQYKKEITTIGHEPTNEAEQTKISQMNDNTKPAKIETLEMEQSTIHEHTVDTYIVLSDSTSSLPIITTVETDTEVISETVQHTTQTISRGTAIHEGDIENKIAEEGDQTEEHQQTLETETKLLKSSLTKIPSPKESQTRVEQEFTSPVEPQTIPIIATESDVISETNQIVKAVNQDIHEDDLEDIRPHEDIEEQLACLLADILTQAIFQKESQTMDENKISQETLNRTETESQKRNLDEESSGQSKKETLYSPTLSGEIISIHHTLIKDSEIGEHEASIDSTDSYRNIFLEQRTVPIEGKLSTQDTELYQLLEPHFIEEISHVSAEPKETGSQKSNLDEESSGQPKKETIYSPTLSGEIISIHHTLIKDSEIGEHEASIDSTDSYRNIFLEQRTVPIEGKLSTQDTELYQLLEPQFIEEISYVSIEPKETGNFEHQILDTKEQDTTNEIIDADNPLEKLEIDNDEQEISSEILSTDTDIPLEELLKIKFEEIDNKDTQSKTTSSDNELKTMQKGKKLKPSEERKRKSSFKSKDKKDTDSEISNKRNSVKSEKTLDALQTKDEAKTNEYTKEQPQSKNTSPRASEQEMRETGKKMYPTKTYNKERSPRISARSHSVSPKQTNLSPSSKTSPKSQAGTFNQRDIHIVPTHVTEWHSAWEAKTKLKSASQHSPCPSQVQPPCSNNLEQPTICTCDSTQPVSPKMSPVQLMPPYFCNMEQPTQYVTASQEQFGPEIPQEPSLYTSQAPGISTLQEEFLPPPTQVYSDETQYRSTNISETLNPVSSNMEEHGVRVSTMHAQFLPPPTYVYSNNKHLWRCVHKRTSADISNRDNTKAIITKDTAYICCRNCGQLHSPKRVTYQYTYHTADTTPLHGQPPKRPAMQDHDPYHIIQDSNVSPPYTLQTIPRTGPRDGPRTRDNQTTVYDQWSNLPGAVVSGPSSDLHTYPQYRSIIPSTSTSAWQTPHNIPSYTNSAWRNLPAYKCNQELCPSANQQAYRNRRQSRHPTFNLDILYEYPSGSDYYDADDESPR